MSIYSNLIWLVIGVSVLALLLAYLRTRWVGQQSPGNERMQKLASHIADGAVSFLKAEYKVLGIFVACMAVLLALSAHSETSHAVIGIAFVVGAFLSALAGFIGMRVATKANVRTTEAARTGLSQPFRIAFAGGTVMGISVASLGLLGIVVLLLILQSTFGYTGEPLHRVLEILTGFSLGGETIALFARIGGGIFTKAADVGADLVGKVEAGIPEDDPRNPAVVADNVGDNVGDVAGMGADLFGSYVSTIIATMVLGAMVVSNDIVGGLGPVILPIAIAALGLLFSIVGMTFVRIGDNGDPQKALNRGNFIAMALTVVAAFFLVKNIMPETFAVGAVEYPTMNIFYSIITGLAVGYLMSIITEYYCSMGKPPVNSIIRQSVTGAGTNIIAGLGVGMMSTALPVIVLAIGIVVSFELGGIYGVAMAATGMMSTTAIQLAVDAFGPIADNAGGIAEMSHLPKEVRERTDVLDAVGNTTAAIGKGFAIASAALTSLSLFAAFISITKIEGIDISNARVLAGLMVGGMIPFLFSALTMQAVGRAANAMVLEVRRQFKTIPGLLEGKEGVEPDYDRCIAISTKASIRQMILPGLLAIVSPVLVGFLAGPRVLGGLLAGITISGILLAIFQSNAGGAWDNAKKSFEKKVLIDGVSYGKGSDPHKATVIGDTVGDPFKDTSGPSMNILIKLTSIVSLIIASMIA